MALNAAQRSLRARGAAFALHAGGGTTTEKAREAFMERFRRQVDPDSQLDPAVRERRAQAALRSHMAMLSLKASKARSS